MHMDIAMQNVEKMRLQDPAKFNKLVQEGMAIELGIISPADKKAKNAEKLKEEFFPNDAAYREVSQGVLDGKRAVVEPKVKALIDAGKDPVDIVTNALMPGITVQCEMYDLGLSFVPEILMSNDAMQGGIKLCQDKIGDVPSKGNIASFVAAGDLHDIGKNICAAILRANGFKVFDIGRDVPKEKVLEVVKENNIKLVCGSTLMSTTKPGLIDTALLLELEKTGVSVACGGAAVSKAFVDTFRNSLYTKSPLETVHTAQKIMDGKTWEEIKN
ncbi:MAG: methylthiol--CoM methyltransferase [Thermoplasmata archaeon]|jgi:methylated-thiol--corrinoid protein|nr:methylthiol--CoM methyltransferase [Thermoplasmata archaeon]